jgi:hypothetical protein
MVEEIIPLLCCRVVSRMVRLAGADFTERIGVTQIRILKTELTMHRDYKLGDLVPLIRISVRDAVYPSPITSAPVVDGRVQPSLVKTPALHAVVIAFQRNVDRIDSVALLLPYFVHMGMHSAKHGGLAWATCGSTVYQRDIRTGDLVEGIIGRGWETVAEYLDNRANIKTGVEGALSQITHWSYLEEDAVDAWLASLVVGAWTAFEVMATDLWEEALNDHPQGLAGLQGKARNEAKSINVTLLQKHNYDIRKKMGTILKDKLKARGLEDIRAGYMLAFAEHNSNIKSALDDQSLDRLQSLRNVLVHQAGIADKKFCKAVDKYQMTEFEGIAGKSSVQLDGKIVRDIINPAMAASVKLIQAVDGWLCSH